jgi:hypothetical protein
LLQHKVVKEIAGEIRWWYDCSKMSICCALALPNF